MTRERESRMAVQMFRWKGRVNFALASVLDWHQRILLFMETFVAVSETGLMSVAQKWHVIWKHATTSESSHFLNLPTV